MVAALNGVLGDYLVASGNPLAITMTLRVAGETLTLERAALAAAFPQPGDKVVILVHGLCMNDLQWQREGHDHGAALARDLGYTPIYLHYNTGRPITANGRDLAASDGNARARMAATRSSIWPSSGTAWAGSSPAAPVIMGAVGT